MNAGESKASRRRNAPGVGPRAGARRDLEQAPPHLRPQLRLGHVLQHEFGRQRASELPVGGVEAVRRLEAVEPLQAADAVACPAGNAA